MAHQADSECIKKLSVPCCTKRRSASSSSLRERNIAKIKPFRDVAVDVQHEPSKKVFVRAFNPYEDVEKLAKNEIKNLMNKESKTSVPKIKIDCHGNIATRGRIRSATSVKDVRHRFKLETNDRKQTVQVPVYKEKQQAAVKGPSKNVWCPPFNSTTKENANKENAYLSKKNIQPIICVHHQIPNPRRIDISPILLNPFTDECVVISKRIDRIREPKLRPRSSRKKLSDFYNYDGDVYNEEYLEDFIEVIKRTDKDIVLHKDFISNFQSDYQNPQTRGYVINWMFKLQADVNMNESEFYLAVNLLDQVAARIAIPTNMYQLVALTTVWIADKSLGCNQRYASDLLNECNNVYSSQQLFHMEQKVLKLLNFKIHIIEPSVVLNYYLKVLKIHDIQLAIVSTYYILDCFTLCPEFSIYPISIIGAAVVTVCIQMYMVEKTEQIEVFFQNKMRPKELRIKRFIEGLLYSQLHKMKTEEYPFKNILKKDYFNKIIGK